MPDQQTALDRHPLEAHVDVAAEQAGTDTGKHVRAETVIQTALQAPIEAAVGPALEIDLWTHQGDAVHAQLSGQQRHHADMDVKRFDLPHRHIGNGLAVANPHLCGREFRLRHHGEIDIAVDFDMPAGGRFELGDDLRLEPIPVDKARPRQQGCEHEHRDCCHTVENRLQRCILRGIKRIPFKAISRKLAQPANAGNLTNATMLI